MPLLTVIGLVGLQEAWRVLQAEMHELVAARWRIYLLCLAWVVVLGNLLILDIIGRATPEVLEYLQPAVAADEGVLRYLEKTTPDYLVILPNWYLQLAEMAHLFQPVHTIEVGSGTIAGGPRLVAYRTVWASGASEFG